MLKKDNNVVQVALLGLAKSGKTTFAVQLVSNFALTNYTHTLVSTVYMSTVKVMLDRDHPISKDVLKRKYKHMPEVVPHEKPEVAKPVTFHTRVKLVDTPGEREDDRFKKRLSSAEIKLAYSNNISSPTYEGKTSGNATSGNQDQDSESAPLLQNQFENSQRENHDAEIPIVLIGNKKDLLQRSDLAKMDLEKECHEWCQNKPFVTFYSGSVLKNDLELAGASILGGFSVSEVMSKLVTQLYIVDEDKFLDPVPTNGKGPVLSRSGHSSKAKVSSEIGFCSWLHSKLCPCFY